MPVAGADVIVTRAPDRLSLAAKAGPDGRYRVVFADGTGDYLVHVSALGLKTFRKRVTRTGAESVLTVDATLVTGAPPQLVSVRVEASRPKPSRDRPDTAEAGAAESFAAGVNGTVSPDQAGDIAALAATIPGVVSTPGGVSVLGIQSAQNLTTINGMAFSAADIPRDAGVRTRVTTTTYDPARGWFGGANVDLELPGGGMFGRHPFRVTADAPALQYTDPISARTGGRFTNTIVGTGGSGPLGDDRWFYNYGVQGSRRAADAVGLFEAHPDLLANVGVASDSVIRLRELLAASRVPLDVAGSSRRLTQQASFIGRIDHAPFDWTRGTDAKATWSMIGFAKYGDASAVESSPTAASAHAGRDAVGVGMLQGIYSTYFGRDGLSDTRTAVSVNDSRTTPYLDIPEGRVLVSSVSDGVGGIAPLTFGGYGRLFRNARTWTWETTNETQFAATRKSAHRVKLNADVRLDRYSQAGAEDRLGTFAFQSLGDLAANRPASFTRTLNAPTLAGGEWNGFASVGDLWHASPQFQLLYGARLEANRFTARPAYSPAVDMAFGARTDHAPNTMHVSPRLGFLWARRPGERSGVVTNSLGRFNLIPSSLRGGIGEFRSLIAPTLLADASAATGLPSSVRRLTCVGPAAPAPDWGAYVQSPGAIPTDCVADAPSAFADAAPSVLLVDPSYRAPRSWRANLAYSSGVRAFQYSVEGVYSRNVDQPGTQDLNFSGRQRFVTGDEGRPVYAAAGEIVPATGAVAPNAARLQPAFGRVVARRSAARSDSRQLTVVVTPTLANRPLQSFVSLAYTLASTRQLAAGFDAPTFARPDAMEWSRGDLDVRHQFILQAGHRFGGVSVTLFGRLASGFPFTPLVGSDVNGDGLANDRAFAHDPAVTSDSGLATGVRRLLGGSSAARTCLAGQLGRAVGRNSCEGPWTAALNTQVRFALHPLRDASRPVYVALNLANPLGGVDQLLHGSDHLRGWGTSAAPDPLLYRVRGFDATGQRFLYEVNPRFGNASPAVTSLRAPFRITLDVGVDIGPSQGRQQLERWVNQGRAGHRGQRLTAGELQSRYVRNVPDPYAGIVQESDSLLLSPGQTDALTTARTAYRTRVDSIWADLAQYLADLPDRFDGGAVLRRQESAVNAAWELTRQDVQRTLPGILSPVQLALLPWPTNLLYAAKRPVRDVRVFVSGR